jgi:hypothetical protein
MLWSLWGDKNMKRACQWRIGIVALVICLPWILPVYASVLDEASPIRTPVSHEGADARQREGGTVGPSEVALEANGPATIHYTTNGSETGSIAGTVTDKDTGAGIQWASVTAVSVNSGSWYGFGFTNSSGAYTMTGLTSGSYKLRFSRDGYIDVWSGDKPDQQSATSVVVTAPNVTTGIDAVLAKGGSITGTVTDKDTGAGIKGAYVVPFRAVDGSGVIGVSTESSGAYTITGLASGSYKLRFSRDGYVDGWSGDKPDQQSATSVVVTAPNVIADINASLAWGGTISGNVSGQDTGAGIPTVHVYAIDRTTGTWGGGATTDQNGAYTINGLATGSYRLKFESPYNSDYIDRWYGVEQCADAVTVTAPNAVTGIDASLVRGASISGRLTDAATGTGIPGTVNCFSLSSPNVIAFASYLSAGSTGAYTIRGLPSGEYSVSFSAPDYIGKPNALKLSLTTGSAIANVDVALNRGGAIGGRVTDSVTGAAVGGVMVDAVNGLTSPPAYDVTDDNGDYRISGLPGGSYTLRYDGSPSGYANGLYSDQPGSPATPVTVTAPATTAAINFGISRVGGISGRVTDKSSAEPLRWISVVAYDAAIGNSVGSGFTDADGTYSIIGLPTGMYKMQFSSASSSTDYYPRSWYGGSSYSEAAIVVVQSPDITSGIDAGLLKGGAISGLISSTSCPGPRWVNIRAYDAVNGNLAGEAWTYRDYSERFTLGGLPVGSYKLLFDVIDDGYLLQWYPNSGNAAGAEPVAVTAGATTDGVNASLASGGGSIAGHVFGQFPTGTISASVKLYDWNSGGFVAQQDIYHNGSYQFSGLTEGSYKLLFTVNGQERWYRSAGETAEASPVVVTNGSAVTGIDIFLTGAVVINGGALYTTSPKVALSLGYYPAATQMQLYFNGKSWSKPEPYATTKSITLPKGDGLKAVQVRYLAADGSVLGEYSASITLDTHLPGGSMTINGGASYTNSRTVSLEISATDATSGIAGVCLKENSLPCGDGEFEPFAAGKTFTITTFGDGKKTVYATLRDLAGKSSKPIKASIILDTVAPTGSIVINGGKAITATQLVTLKLKADKASEMMLSLDGGVTWGGWEKFVSSKKVSLAAGAEKLVQVRFRDLAGNESGVITADTVVGAEIIQQYNFHVVGEPVVETISLPKKFNYAGWEAIEPLCQETGYSLVPYGGSHVAFVTYRIAEKWYSPIPANPGADLYLRVIGKNGKTLCGYLSVREDSTAASGVFALNDPAVK